MGYLNVSAHELLLNVITKALFFSVENKGCGMSECGKGEEGVGECSIFFKVWKEWVSVGDS